MPSEYHALYTLPFCLIQDQSTSRNRRYCKLCDAMKTSKIVLKEIIEPGNRKNGASLCFCSPVNASVWQPFCFTAKGGGVYEIGYDVETR